MSKQFGTTAAAVAMAAVLAGSGFALGRVSRAAQAAANPPAGVSAPSTAAGPPANAAAMPAEGALASFAALAERASPAVVHIKVVSMEKATQRGAPFEFGGGEMPFPPFSFGAPPAGSFVRRGTGSGFVIRNDGVIVTNNHVVQDAKEITVTLADKREYPARVLGRDPKTDLAVLKIDAPGTVPTAALGNSDAVRVGDWVMAIGNPFGLSNTVTAGIVSAKGRALGTGPYDDFIQTDASINPGNSGGPLFNARGEVIGINTMIFSRTGDNVGIGFAIPINLAKELVPELESSGHVTRGWLGVSIQTLTPELAQSLHVDPPHGALVADVTRDSPAAAAGIERGDVIVAYDGKDVADSTALPTMVAETPIGKNVTVAVLRNGTRKTLPVSIAKLDEPVPADATAAKPAKWGLALKDLTPEERGELGLGNHEGVLVAEVVPGSPADDAGVKAGDVILQANRVAVGSAADLKRQADRVDSGQPLLLLVRPADGATRFAALSAK
jgi:serine protease Do